MTFRPAGLTYFAAPLPLSVPLRGPVRSSRLEPPRDTVLALNGVDPGFRAMTPHMGRASVVLRTFLPLSSASFGLRRTLSEAHFTRRIDGSAVCCLHGRGVAAASGNYSGRLPFGLRTAGASSSGSLFLSFFAVEPFERYERNVAWVAGCGERVCWCWRRVVEPWQLLTGWVLPRCGRVC